MKRRNIKHLAVVLLVAGTIILSGALGRTVAFGIFLVVYGFCMIIEALAEKRGHDV